MGPDVYFSDDIRNALLAADAGSAATAEMLGMGSGDVQAIINYRRGYRAALITVALAFGLRHGRGETQKKGLTLEG